jgi:hypothetical protein
VQNRRIRLFSPFGTPVAIAPLRRTNGNAR